MEVKRFMWRQTPLTFVTKMITAHAASNTNPEVLAKNTLLVAGSATMVDIWSLDAAKIIHVFETKKDRIKSLDLLCVRNNTRLLLLAGEEKDGQPCSSIICIFQDENGSGVHNSNSQASLGAI
jgi:hypothetical protein